MSHSRAPSSFAAANREPSGLKATGLLAVVTRVPLLGTVQPDYRIVDNHVRHRLRRWLKAKYKVRGPEKVRFPKGYLYETLGLHSLRVWPGSSSSANV
jgi:hypothetical protein